MTTSTNRGFGHMVAKLAFVSLLAAGFNLSAVTNVVVEADQTFTFKSPNHVYNSEDYELVVNAGATVQFPPSGSFNAFVYLKGNGTVTFKKPDYTTYNGGDQVSFKNGIAAESTVKVVIEDVTTVNVGRVSASGDVHYPVVDVANMEFKQTGGKLVLTDKCTARTLPSSFEVASGATVALQGTNPLGLDSDFALTDYDIVVLMRAAIPDGCTITVPPGRTLGLKPAITAKRDSGEAASTYNWNWSGWDSYFDESFNIVLGGKGAKVRCRCTSTRLCLFTPVTGTGEVLFMPDSNVKNSRLVFHGVAYVATKSNPVVVPVNTAADPVVSDAWKSKVAHWFDASDTTTVIKYTRTSTALRNKFEGQYPVVVGWLDHVKGYSDTFLYNRDAQNGHYPYDLPYLVEGGLNGKDYLSFGVYYPDIVMSQVDSQDCPADKHIQRWIQFVKASSGNVTGDAKPDGGKGSYTTIDDCKYCIMVFGSQFGGGKSLLGDQKQQSSDVPLGNLARNGSSISQPWLAYNGYSMMVDGVGINPKTAKPNGRWQIISLDMSATNTVLDCLGGHNVTTDGGNLLDGRKMTLTGGQNYAEVLLFNEVPTDAERIACEAYLANKWGLISTHSARAEKEVFSDISGGTGTTMTLADYDYTENNVNVTNPTPAEVTIAGNYRGTINIAAGKTLVVSDRPAPLDAYDIPQQENIAAWFDPSFDGAIDFHANAEVAAAGGIARLYSRTAGAVDTTDSFYLAMQGSPLDSVNTRYPFLLETSYSGAHGIADTMKWLDFTQNGTGDSLANNLRSHLMPAQDSHITGTGVDKLPAVRSVFMSIDTSVGGGNPIADTVGMNGMFLPRNGTSAANPIWSTQNTVTMAHTWLDTNEVDGTTHGFNGRGEVLGFEMPEAKRMAVVLAYYNQGDRKNYEHIGETIIYSTTLSDAERLTVQEYLMAKWTGDMNGKYSDLSGATVTGAGNVKSAALRNLPKFDAGFTGTLSGGSNMTFTVDSSLNASAALDAITIDRAVTLDSACTVTVTLKGKAKAGTYTLLTVPSGSLAGKNFKLNIVNETGKAVPAKLVSSDTTLSLELTPPGLAILLQ